MQKLADAPPQDWQTVTIDLWTAMPEGQRRPWNIGGMTFGALGGPAAIDRIRLGRTQSDLP
jgi:hypothetical protein